MRTYVHLSWAILLASIAFAAPLDRLQKRQRPQFQGRPVNVTASEYYFGSYAGTTEAGVVETKTGVTSVTGIITVPTISKPPKGTSSTEYGVAAWVGIDGVGLESNTCINALFQAGVECTVQNGAISCEAWSEWYPAVSNAFANFAVAAGDEIKVTLTTSSATAGVATVEHVKLQTSASQSYSGQPALCRESADWIVEDFEVCTSTSASSCGFIPLAEFTPIVFTSASYVAGGVTGGITGANTITMDSSSGSTEVNCTTNSGSELTCDWYSSGL